MLFFAKGSSGSDWKRKLLLSSHWSFQSDKQIIYSSVNEYETRITVLLTLHPIPGIKIGCDLFLSLSMWCKKYSSFKCKEMLVCEINNLETSAWFNILFAIYNTWILLRLTRLFTWKPKRWNNDWATGFFIYNDWISSNLSSQLRINKIEMQPNLKKQVMVFFIPDGCQIWIKK